MWLMMAASRQEIDFKEIAIEVDEEKKNNKDYCSGS